MAKAFNQKMKILYLIQMLMKYTDEEHVLNMQEIITELEQKGVKSERKSIYDDFETMRQFGVAVRFKKSQPSGYYIVARDLEPAEIKKIVCLVKHSSDVSEEEAQSLIDKLKQYLSIYQAEKMMAEIALEEAAEKEQKAKLEIPQEVKCETYKADDKKESQDAGEIVKEEVQLLFKEKHTQAVISQFGEEIHIKQHKESIYKVKVMTEVNAKFYGWLSSHGMGIKVVKPKHVAEEYRVYLKKLLKQYK